MNNNIEDQYENILWSTEENIVGTFKGTFVGTFQKIHKEEIKDKTEEKSEKTFLKKIKVISIFPLLCVCIVLVIVMVIGIIFYHLENVDKRRLKAEMEERIGVMQKEVSKLRDDSIRLDSLLKKKELHIKLDVQGIPQRKGGGITVNNIH